MEQTVYIDLFFLINFSMDFLCFYLTSRLLSYRLSVKRCVIASSLGGIYACASLFLALGGIWGLIADMSACVIMSAVAVLKKGRVKDIFGYSIVYTACSVVLGGAMTALFSLFNRLGVDRLFGDGGDGDGISVWIFALLALISGLLSFGGIKLFRRRSARREGEVEVVYAGKSVVLRAICDSGNLLTEPISAKPCIVAESREIKRILPAGMVEMIEKGRAEGLDKRDMGRLRIVPAQTVSGGGILYALRADSVRVNMGGGWVEVDAFVALCSLDRGAEGAQALIPSSMLLGAP